MDDMKYQFAISEAAVRSGVSAHTIRKWEDRYGAVSPHRSEGGTRRYSLSQVKRLALLKDLVGAGHGIGSIASLATEKLIQLRSTSAILDGPGGLVMLRTVVFGATLPEILSGNRAQLPGLDIVGMHSIGEDAVEEDVDVIVVELPALDESAVLTLTRIRERARARCVVVAYSFATHQLVQRLTTADTACLRMPFNLREMQRAIESIMSNQGNQSMLSPAPRRYSKAVLAQVAAMQPTIACECPRHVAELVSALADFETYSEQCESRNSLDASLHHYLKIAASHARATLESALTAVATHENIPLAQWQRESDIPASEPNTSPTSTV